MNEALIHLEQALMDLDFPLPCPDFDCGIPAINELLLNIGKARNAVRLSVLNAYQAIKEVNQ